MPGYVAKCLRHFNHLWRKMQDSPHPWNEPAYGAHKQYADRDISPFLNAEMKTLIQQIIGSFLFYGRAVDPTMLTALNAFAEYQAQPTEQTKKNIDHFLDYCATHPDASIRYHKSDMQLWCDSDAAYLVAKNARSRIAGHFYLSDKVTDPKKPQANPTPNGPLHTEVAVIKNVVSSSTEAEIAGTFHNGKICSDLCTRLDEANHPQIGPTPVKTDNENSERFANKNVKRRLTKHMDMRYHWVQDRTDQGEITVYWAPGAENLADYFTKHHHPIYHRRIRKVYVQDPVEATRLNCQTALTLIMNSRK